MTWGECRLAALQTMFANEGTQIEVDDTNQEYLNAMPAKANEAAHLLALAGRPRRKRFTIEVRGGAEAEETEEKLTLPQTAERYRICLRHYRQDFRAIGEVKLENADGYGAAEDWQMEGDDELLVPGDAEGTYTVWYDAYPQKFTAQTEDTETIDLPEELCVLMPLYIASELYKEDELAMATMWRNEFEDGLAKVREAYEKSITSRGAGTRPSVTGWW